VDVAAAPGIQPGPERPVVTVQTGGAWDALCTPQELALPVLVKAHADDHDRQILGPVLHDADARTVYWLLQPGSNDTYPDGCRLLPSGTWLPLPHPQRLARSLAWLYLPEPDTLTPPAWLTAALTHPTPEAHP
jgi:hypothetical protein